MDRPPQPSCLPRDFSREKQPHLSIPTPVPACAPGARDAGAGWVGKRAGYYSDRKWFSARSTLRSGREQLSDNPFCLSKKFFSPPFKGLGSDHKSHKGRAGGVGTERPSLLNPERSVMQTLRPRKGQWTRSPLESLCQSRAKGRPVQRAEL